MVGMNRPTPPMPEFYGRDQEDPKLFLREMEDYFADAYLPSIRARAQKSKAHSMWQIGSTHPKIKAHNERQTGHTPKNISLQLVANRVHTL